LTRALQPIRLASPESLPAEQLIDWGQAKVPVGTLIAHIRSSEQTSGDGGRDRIGVWECTPGSWRRQVMEREFAHFLSGRARFIPDDGEPFDICAGDAVWFPADTTGTWEISETLRKSYVIIGFRPAERIRRATLRKLNALRMLFVRVFSRRQSVGRQGMSHP
jgi:uncharacterized cupin superfamily protein